MTLFEQLYSTEQLAAFHKVQAALVRDPTALDNRGGAAHSVTSFDTAEKKDDQA